MSQQQTSAVANGKVYKSAVIPAPLESVWSLVRSFNGLPSWSGGVIASEIENNQSDNTIGCIRRLTIEGSDIPFRETLLAFDERNHSYSYDIVTSSLPITGYYATVSLKPVTDENKTFAEWSTEFYTQPEHLENCVKIVEGIFSGGLESLKKKFAK
ncbi:hypothetical protein FDP41_004116 [Naegleria fowleri]|uniref:Bet v I/Major latex protein domain-containing protein n=1 Tax=Naegleria fowleri TaxID=5763 RepID=A0A6A5BRB8_NAEFO|nr:uncharacterized protein FDP41_004116 [Naegleria fowleri]KAF0976821.1 hypothetical protein FDP41_004116 [Naegleria fowleri]CAG4716166.1 unnamed protein product [Naegleria fowleri]